MRALKAEIIIAGGGAAGLFAAARASALGADCLVLEPNGKTGRKLRITGKGRCNLTNNCDQQTLMDNIPVNPRFLHGAFSRFGPAEVMGFFEAIGVPLKTERGNRVFPVSDSANQVADALEAHCRKNGVRFMNARARKLLTENGAIAGVSTGDAVIECESLILCTGGLSYPATGSTGEGYDLASALGHTIIEPKPSLVPLRLLGGGYSELQGLSLKNVILRAYEENQLIFEELGEMLFTHFGVSGPLVLSASSHMRRFGERAYHLELDLKPGLDDAALDRRLISDLERHKNNDFCNSLGELLPRKLIPVVIAASGIDPRLKSNSVTREQRLGLLRILKGFPMVVAGPRPIDEAIITSGGVSVKEVDPKTMESKLVPGLFFAGEILDVDAYTGGFNLQIAWSTANAAAEAAAGR